MPIDFESETNEINSKLKEAVGYLACEKVIINNIRKLLFIEIADPIIEDYLKKLMKYFESLIEKNKDSKDRFNYIYAASFVNVLITTPYWHSWIKTIK